MKALLYAKVQVTHISQVMYPHVLFDDDFYVSEILKIYVSYE